MGDNGRRQGETRPWEGGHTIQHKRILWGDNGETRPREGGHAIQHRHTCGETVGDNRRQGRDQRRQTYHEVLSPLVSHCSPFSPIVSPHVCLCWMVCPSSRSLIPHCLPLSPQMACPPSRRLVSELSPIVPTCVPVLDVVYAFPRTCLPLSPFLSILVSGCLQLSRHMCLCWMVHLPEVLFFIVSHCLPRYVCLCWMVRPPSRGLVSPFLPTCHMCACVGWCLRLGWCVRLPAVLCPLVCLCWVVCPPSRGLVSLVSHLPSRFPLLDGVSAFPCVPLSACVGWCVRLPEVLSPLVLHFLIVPLIVFHCLPSCLPVSPCLRLCAIVSHCLPHVCLCWMVCPPSEVLSPHCLPAMVPVLDGVSALDHIRLQEALSPIVSPHVCLCWMLCPPSRGLVSVCLPLSPHMCACVGWCVPPSQGLGPPCLPLSCVPVLDGASAFPRSCLPLSPIVSLLVSLLVSLCWMASRGFVSLVSQLVSQLVFLLVSQLVSQLVFLLVSLCGGWSDFAFFSNSVLLGVGFLKVSVRLGVGWCVRLPEVLSPILSPSLSLFLFPFVAGGLILHFFLKQCMVRGS